MKAESRINRESLSQISQTSLSFANKAGQSEELKQGVANLAKNAPEGSKTASFTTNLSKALNFIGIAGKLYGLVKPLTVATK